jgi:hypothetical protein
VPRIGAILKWTGARVQSESFRGQYRIDEFLTNWFTRDSVLNSLHRGATSEEPINFVAIVVVMIVVLLSAASPFASTQGLNQIATPDMPPEGGLALSGGNGANPAVRNRDLQGFRA